jgi:hypothetical protein
VVKISAQNLLVTCWQVVKEARLCMTLSRKKYKMNREDYLRLGLEESGV